VRYGHHYHYYSITRCSKSSAAGLLALSGLVA
jgi:hypothetical protein